ncbi:MAG: DUF808 domain-containing protein [Actinomycetaceae bacterium]|nr:DUF808 domain-containing protein [Actinomycetaceae bacterium]
MAFGLAALLDDVAALTKAAAASIDDVAAGAVKASSKAMAVVVDDTAVTPQYVKGIDPKREIPIIKRIAKGSLVNKSIILVLALLLSQFAPWALTPLLMAGGAYLCFEGAHKIWDKIHGHHVEAAVSQDAGAEDGIVTSAVRTDFILSAEIMVIALNEVASSSFAFRTAALAIVAVVITAFVYGLVALLVKADDAGLALARRDSRSAQRAGRAIVAAMPKVLSAITVVGVAAMLWVGGHLLVTGVAELGWHGPHNLIASLAHSLPGGVLQWSADTACSLVVGFCLGSLLVAARAVGERLVTGLRN